MPRTTRKAAPSELRAVLDRLKAAHGLSVSDVAAQIGASSLSPEKGCGAITFTAILNLERELGRGAQTVAIIKVPEAQSSVIESVVRATGGNFIPLEDARA